MKTKPMTMPATEAQRAKAKISIGSFFISLVVHGGLLLMIGGIVMVEGVVPKTTFAPPEGYALDEATAPAEILMPDEQPPVPENDLPPTETSEPQAPQVSAPVVGAPLTNLITTTQSSAMPAFSMPSVALPSSPGPVGTGPGQPAATTGAGRPTGGMMKTLFGDLGAQTGALNGRLYDLKQTPDRKPSDMTGTRYDLNAPENKRFDDVLREFISKNWSPKVLEKYYRTKEPMSAWQIFMPRMAAEEAPKAFNVQKEVSPMRWAVHYEATVEAPETCSFRFIGHADDVLAVRFNGREVLDAGFISVTTRWSEETTYKVTGTGNHKMRAGPWIEVEQGKTYPMEVLVAERPGGIFYAFLLFEKKGENYRKRRDDSASPQLPVFQLAPIKVPKYTPGTDAPEVDDKGYLFGRR